MAIDRDAALKKAEKLLRQGKLDGAIEEYVRLIEDQPHDWNSINALGDLHLRAGDVERAVAQFVKVADHLFAEGFLPKAAALYKKALKNKADHEHTLRQLGEIAARQGLLADAKTYLRQLSELRRLRGDEQGAAEPLIRLGTLEESDADSQIAAARAAQAIGDTRQAAALLRAAADDLEKRGRRQEALDLLLSVARTELASQEADHAHATLTRVLTTEPDRRGDVMAIAFDLAREGRLDTAFGCVDVVTDAALLEGDCDRAVDALQTFVRDVPYVPALIKLVETCVDAGLDAPLRDAQARLADAYLEQGRGAEARVISEDLLDREPGLEDHAIRLRRALELLGVADATNVVEERLRNRRPFEDFSESIDVPPQVAAQGPPSADAPPEAAAAAEMTASPEIDEPSEIAVPMEIDLSETLRGMATYSEVNRIATLQQAASVPQTRFRAASELGRICLSRGQLQAAVEWLERAAETPPPTPEEGFGVLYDLADALHRLGETARALAMLVELDADSGGYRDVRDRIEQLARAQAGSHGR